MHIVIVTTHPIQYQAPLFRELAQKVDLTVLFMMRQTPQGQAASGFGVEFEWDIPLLEGYRHVFANNIALHPSTMHRDGIILKGHKLLLASLRPDVMMTMGWFPRGLLQVIQWAERAKVPLVCRGESNLVSSRSLLKRIAKFFYFPRLLSKFAAFAVIGCHNHEFYRHYGVPESRLHFAPYSVDTNSLEAEFQRHRPPLRKPGPWRIGFAGKLIPKKRPLDLVSAVGRSRHKSRIQLVIIGDGPLRSEVEASTRANDVQIDFRGFLNQSQIVAKGYADLDALVLPSGEYETWGLVINEAMTGGVPVIVSDMVGCAPDLVHENVTGHQFPSGDVAALASRIDQLVVRLETGHDFSPAVLQKIAPYSLARTVEGLKKAFLAACLSSGGRDKCAF